MKERCENWNSSKSSSSVLQGSAPKGGYGWNPSETTAAHPLPLRLSLAFLMPITFRTMAGFKIAWSRAQNPLNHSTQHCVYDSSANGLPGNVVSGNMFSASL